jgi:hypothetical protein
MIAAAEKAALANYEVIASMGALPAAQDAAARGASVDAAAQAYLADQAGSAARAETEAAAATRAAADAAGELARADLEVAAAGAVAAAGQATVAAAAGAAGATAGQSIPVWHRWLDLIHFTFAVFGANLVADTIGIAAFGASAVANLGPAVEAVNNLGQTYGYLNKQQMAAADAMTRLKNSFEGAVNTGVFAVFYGLLDIIGQKLGATGGVLQQATHAFENFAAMLENDFASPQWAVLFSRSSSVVQTDLEALGRLLSAFIQLIPGLLHDFNGLGLGVLNSATLIMRGLAFLSEADPRLTQFAYAAYLANRAFKYLWTGMGTGPGPFQQLVQWIPQAITGISHFIQVARSQGIVEAISLFTGLSTTVLGVAGAFGVMLAVDELVAAHVDGGNAAFQEQIDLLKLQDNAIGSNVAGWEKFSAQTSQASNSLQQQAIASSNARFGLVGLSMALQQQSNAYRSASSGALQQVANLHYLMQTYHLTAAQAYQLGQAVSVNWQKAFGPTTITALKNYEQAVNAARNPLTAVQYDMQQAANQALQLDDRVTALTNAFNVMLGPLNTVIGDSVTFSNDLQTMVTDLAASAGKVGLNTAAQKASAQAMAQAANDAQQLSQATLQQTGSVARALVPLEQLRNAILRSGASGAWARQELAALNQMINALHSKTVTITVAGQITGSGAAAISALSGGGGQGGVGHRVIPGTGPCAQTGAQYAAAGLTLVGEMGPELVRFGGGEQVVPSWQTAGILHSGGGGEGTINLATHNVVMVGGQRMQSQVVTQSLTYQRRNPSNNLNLRTR